MTLLKRSPLSFTPSASPRLRVRLLSLIAVLISSHLTSSTLTAQTTLTIADPTIWSKGGPSIGPATSLAATAEKTPDDQPAIRVNYDIKPVEGKLAYAEFTHKPATPISPAPALISIWIKGDGKLCPLRLRFRDSAGRHFQWTLARTTAWTQWRKLTIELKPGAPGFNTWGGPGNSITSNAAIKIEPPLIFESFIIDRREEPTAGSLLIGGLALE